MLGTIAAIYLSEGLNSRAWECSLALTFLLGEMDPKCPYSTLNRGETPSTPRLHHRVLFSHFAVDV